MTTQDQKDKKIDVAGKQRDDAVAKLEKARAKLADVERVYAEDKTAAAAKVTELEPTVRAAEEYVAWVKAMPVSGSAAGPVGDPGLPAG